MDFIEQTKDLKLTVVSTPRVFIEWNNTETGRDVHDRYERVVDFGLIRYINYYNSSISITKNDKFFDVLEELYNKVIKNEL